MKLLCNNTENNPQILNLRCKIKFSKAVAGENTDCAVAEDLPVVIAFAFATVQQGLESASDSAAAVAVVAASAAEIDVVVAVVAAVAAAAWPSSSCVVGTAAAVGSAGSAAFAGRSEAAFPPRRPAR